MTTTHDPACPNGDPRVIEAVTAAMASIGEEPSGVCEFCPVIARVRATAVQDALDVPAAVIIRDEERARIRAAIDEATRNPTVWDYREDGKPVILLSTVIAAINGESETN